MVSTKIYVYRFCASEPIGGIMISVYVSSAVDRVFGSEMGQIKDYEFGICCFCSQHRALRSKSKDRLTRNQNNVSEWSEMHTRCFSELAL